MGNSLWIKTLGTGSLSAIWSALSWFYRELYRRKVLAAYRLDARVISVGNIQAGGTGKTPLVAQIAREALARGKKVAILSRGYRGEWERSGGLIPPGPGAASARQVGDEAALLHELLPQVWIGVGRNRVASYQRLRRETSFDCVILDDGFQHHRIQRDFQIVLLGPGAPWRRPYREWPRTSLERADLIVLNHGTQAQVDRPVVSMRLRSRSMQSKSFAELTFHLITGVGNPEAVHRALTSEGLRIERHTRMPDHWAYTHEQIAEWLAELPESGALGITGKDWVKWKECGFEWESVLGRRLWVFEPEVVLSESDRRKWNLLLWGN